MLIKYLNRIFILFWSFQMILVFIPSCTNAQTPNIRIGQPKELLRDNPGKPLSEIDFRRARNIQSVSINKEEQDPIEKSGFFQGDIILGSMAEYMDITTKGGTNKGILRNAIINLERRWPKGVIPYLISSAYSDVERARIASAVLNIQNLTCITFVPRDLHKDYIHIVKGDGCSSSVGRTGGPQIVSLGIGCIGVGTIMHELMHSIGFWHEHSRSDRDPYIEIVWSNIETGMKSNFESYDWNTIQSLGIGYDVGSIMHYGPYAFAKNRRLPTIISKTKTEMGQRREFSKRDAQKMNLLYECPGYTKNTESVCKDVSQHCQAWSALGECEKNPLWMKQNCRKSCLQCGDHSVCEDIHIHCPFWAKIGECSSNPNYMLVNCQKSCRRCS